MHKLTPKDVKILFEGSYNSINRNTEDDDPISDNQYTKPKNVKSNIPNVFQDTPVPDEFPEIYGDIILPPELVNQVLLRKKARIQPRDISQIRRVVDEEHMEISNKPGIGQKKQEKPPIPPSDKDPEEDKPPGDPDGTGSSGDPSKDKSDQPGKPGPPGDPGTDDPNQPSSDPGPPGPPGDPGTDDPDQPSGEGGGQPGDDSDQPPGSGTTGEFDPEQQGQGTGQKDASKEGSKGQSRMPGDSGGSKRAEKDTSTANQVAKNNVRDRMRDAQKDFWKKLSPEQRKQLIEQTKKAAEDIEEDKEITREWTRKQIQKATKIDSAGGRGEGHGKDLVDRVIDRMKPQINWKQALKNFVTRRARKYYNIRKPSKRGIGVKTYLPRSEKDRELDKFVVGIDVSGSVMAAYPQFISEIINLFETVQGAEAVIVFWHDVVAGSIELNRKNYKKLLSIQATAGGTTISSFGYWLASLNWSPAGVIIFTDGYFEQNPFLPVKSKRGKKIIYKSFIVPGGNYDVLKPWGDVYKIL